MSVTLEVSKLSGWSNADAPCREVERRASYGVRGEVQAGRRRWRTTSQRAQGGAHAEHAAQPSDAGGVEAQRLVERRHALPRVERRAYGVRGELRPGRMREAGWRWQCKQRAGEDPSADWGRARGVAHEEHVAHIFDAGGVEAQRLVERLRIMEHVVNFRDAGGVEAERLVEHRRAGEHIGHVCDAGGVEAQRLVERRRAGEHAVHVRDAGAVEAQRLVERRRAVEHLVHVRDAGGVPAGNVRIEIPHAIEELAHVGDGRDVPIGDEAILRNGGSRISVVGLDCRLQGGRAREGRWRRPRPRKVLDFDGMMPTSMANEVPELE
eukprot:scaffold6579_cov52-Phaeocystis_antarctica.AAC.3